MDPDRTAGLLLLSPALAWLRSRPWAPVLRALRPELGLIQPAPRPVVEAMVRRLVPAAQRRLDRGGRGRVPARVSEPQRAGGLLRRGAQHLPGRAARRARVLDPPRDASVRLAVRLGPQGHARPDRLHEARREGAAEGTPRRARTAATCLRSSGRARRTRPSGSSWRISKALDRYNLSGELPTRSQDAEPHAGRVRDGLAVWLDDQALAPLRRRLLARASRSSAASSTWPIRPR